MRLRPAASSDLALLQYWHTKPHVVGAVGDFMEVDWQEELAVDADWRELLIAESDGRPIGVVQIIDPAREETHYWGDVEANLRAVDIWIGEEADLGRGYGTEIMRLALDRCFANRSVAAILIDPLAGNSRAHRFYQRLGFRPVERRMFGNDDCLVFRLDRQDWQEPRRA